MPTTQPDRAMLLCKWEVPPSEQHFPSRPKQGVRSSERCPVGRSEGSCTFVALGPVSLSGPVQGIVSIWGWGAESMNSLVQVGFCVCVYTCKCAWSYTGNCRDLYVPECRKCLVLWGRAVDQESRIMLIEM